VFCNFSFVCDGVDGWCARKFNQGTVLFFHGLLNSLNNIWLKGLLCADYLVRAIVFYFVTSSLNGIECPWIYEAKWNSATTRIQVLINLKILWIALLLMLIQFEAFNKTG
jgi:phosphatidylglycerophosphate synthase